jgi:DNA/RNA endonuclease G (NUC1)
MKHIIILLLLSAFLYAGQYYIINNPVYTNIYSADKKIPVIGIVHLTWNIVKEKIKRINKFHDNPIINYNIQAKNSDYYKQGIDKGHFSASNSDWDNNSTDMAYTFAFTNITPQYPKTNRVSYRRVERYGWNLVKKYDSVFVINIAVPSDKYMNNSVNIPSVFYKIFIFKNEKVCYKIPNDNKKYSLKDMHISCSIIGIKTDF